MKVNVTGEQNYHLYNARKQDRQKSLWETTGPNQIEPKIVNYVVARESEIRNFLTENKTFTFVIGDSIDKIGIKGVLADRKTSASYFIIQCGVVKFTSNELEIDVHSYPDDLQKTGLAKNISDLQVR